MQTTADTQENADEEILLPRQRTVEKKIEWMKFGSKLGYLHFVGKDVFFLRNGCYILFHDLITNTEHIYTANNRENGDGVSCVTGHRNSNMFAFGEQCFNPRIFIKEYPNFSTVSVLEGGSNTCYKSLAFSEMEFLISLTGLPDFEITVWNWRSEEKLVSQKTGVANMNQIMRCSQTIPPLVSQMASDSQELLIWEIHSCYKRCLLTKMHYIIKDAVLPCAFTWSPEGILLIADARGTVFMVDAEKRKQQHLFKWTGSQGNIMTSVVWFKQGIVLSGPCGEVKYFKRVGATKWEVSWSIIPEIPVDKLTASTTEDHLIANTIEGDFIKFKIDEESRRFIKISSYKKIFRFVCFINPLCENIATLNASERINTWKVDTGKMIGQYDWKGKCLTMVSNPTQPYLALSRDDGSVDFIDVFSPERIKILTTINLCREPINCIQFSLQGNYIVACVTDSGMFFVIESNRNLQMAVQSFIDMKSKIANFFLLQLTTHLKIVALESTRICCPSGNKIIVCSMSFQNKELIMEALVELPGLYSGIYLNPLGRHYEFYAIPHRSRQLHLLSISREKHHLQLIDAISTGHQLRKYCMSITNHNLLTYGFDGITFLRSLKSRECISYEVTHHRTELGIKEAIASPLDTHIICLGHDGSIICIRLEVEVDEVKQKSLSSALLSGEISSIYTKKTTSGIVSRTNVVTGTLFFFHKQHCIKELEEPKSWLEMQDDIRTLHETTMWGQEKRQLRDTFRNIQKECVAMLKKNYIASEEKLPISEFDLDEEVRNKKIRDAKNTCEKTEAFQEALITAQDALCERLKKKYWNTVDVKDRKLKAIMGRTEVGNYPLFPKDVHFEEELAFIKQRRKLELEMQRVDFFAPWEPIDEETESTYSPLVPGIHKSTLIRRTISSTDTIDDEEQQMMNEFAPSGSSSHEFVKSSPYHHNQFEITTYLQMHNEIFLLRDVETRLRNYFNKQFDDIYAIKEREMFLVKERNTRLRYILSELNNTWTEIIDPEWTQEEQPERIMRVEDDEVSVKPYISPSQQELLDKMAAEAEARRLAELADNFRERALIVMMDGVLEIRWEDEIKKDIPKPKCMLEKDPANYNEEDLKIVKDYEERVAFRMSERNRYRKMLEAEFRKHSQALKDGIVKFNSRLEDLFLLKLKIESAIGQEVLKIYRYDYIASRRVLLYTQEKNLKEDIIEQESKNAQLQEVVQQLIISTNECRAAYDALIAREKHLERSFKKEFPEVSPIILEILLKYYRRRPKMYQRAQTSIVLLKELSRCVMSTDRPSFLPPECIDFLKGLDQIDSHSNCPPNISEELWFILCHVRRLKVECELKTKCCALEVAEAEQTVSVYQKKLASDKQRVATLNEEITKTRQQLLELQHDTELQLVMKQGLVEINTTGSISDYDDSILITHNQVKNINELVKNAGNKKLAAMHKATNFHRVILVKEWQHKKLKMEIEDLQEHLHNLESIKVTKDIQMYLRRRARGVNEEKGILSFEREISLLRESYEKQIRKLQQQLDELDMKINKQRKENRKLDARVTSLNIDVNEKQLLRDVEFETRQSEAAKQRMASIVKRRQLVSVVQSQHAQILALQTELELLRLKTYPTLKYKTLI